MNETLVSKCVSSITYGSVHCAQISGGGPPGIWLSIFLLSHIKSIHVRRKIKGCLEEGQQFREAEVHPGLADQDLV